MRTHQTARTHRPYPDLPLIVAEEGEGRPALVLHGAPDRRLGRAAGAQSRLDHAG